jgi:3-hydroxybutyryl-CoA dehydrogenase
MRHKELEMNRIAVIGGGIMGSGIAEICARAGCRVVVVEADPAGISRCQDRLDASLQRAVRADRMTTGEADQAIRNVEVARHLEAAGTADLVIEAIPEVEPLKLDLFRRLDAILPAEAILASNTSSIPLVKLGSVTERPERVVGVHFFNPAPVLPLVEIVESLLTSPETLTAVTDFAEQRLGKTTIRSKDRAGFVVNALLIPYLLSAIRMFESGFASAEDIDAGMVQGCAHPLGPLALVDLIGLDTTAAVADSMYAEFKEPLYAPPPLLLRMIDAGLLGRKTGRGFFPYAR